MIHNRLVKRRRLATIGCIVVVALLGLLAAPARVAAQVPGTGQTSTYGPGSDGDVQAGTPRSFTDNGDGTVSDNVTGLMWEKKDDSGGIHDRDNRYTWGSTSPPYPMNGTMVTVFLATLNTPPCFAGYCDWRIPNIRELRTIADYERVNPAVDPAFHSAGCGGCTNINASSCSCTASDYYWSSTTYRRFPNYAWHVNFLAGDVYANGKVDSFRVRAVRGGL